MSPDPNETPGQGNPPASSAGQPAPAGGSGTGEPEGYVKKERLDGALAKIQELTLANRALTDQVNGIQTKYGTLEGAVSQKDAEASVKAGEFQKQIQALQEQLTVANTTIKTYESDKLKLKALQEMGRPDLISVMDTIPAGPDLESTKTAFANIAKYADDIKKRRETELLAGLSGTQSVAQVTAPPAPQTEKDWSAHIESLPLGSKERQKAWDAYFAFVNKPKT
jgi:hypothetical protein